MPNRQRRGGGASDDAAPLTMPKPRSSIWNRTNTGFRIDVARLIQERFLCRTKVPRFFRFALTKDVYQQLPPPRLALPHDRHGRPYEAADERSALASRRQRQDTGGSRAAD